MGKKKHTYKLHDTVRINWLGHKLVGKIIKIKEPEHTYKKVLYTVFTGIMKYPVTADQIIEKA